MKLADASRLFKQSILIFIALMVLYFILKFSFIAGTVMIKVLFPPKPPAPTIQFGKIPLPNIESLKTTGTINYELDTISGKLPSGIPNQVSVFQIIKPGRDILAEQRAKQTATLFGFNNSAYTQITNAEWKWQSLVPQRSFKLNILTYNFEIEPNLSQLNLYLRRGDATPEEKATDIALLMLSNHPNVDLKKDRSSFNTDITFARINQEVLEEASSLSEAQLTKVDIFRNVNYVDTKFKIYGEKYDNSYINFYLANGYVSPNKLLKAKVNYWNFDNEKGSTYPLKNIYTAWQQLLDGNATIVKLVEDGEDKYKPYIQKDIKSVKIKSIELAYIVEEDLPKFVQPIFVFTGRFETNTGQLGNYVSYLPALDSNVVK